MQWTWTLPGVRGRLRASGVPFLREDTFRVLVWNMACLSVCPRSSDNVRPERDGVVNLHQIPSTPGVAIVEGWRGEQWSTEVVLGPVVPPLDIGTPGPRSGSRDVGTTG